MKTHSTLLVTPCAAALLAVMLGACAKATTESKPSDTSSSAPASKAEPAAAASATPPAPQPPPADVAAPPADATTTASGLAYKILQPGSGTTHPAAEDVVEVNYTGWQTDGTMFDTTATLGRSVKFPLNRVIKGWTEGLQLMVKGQKARFWIPANLAYGDAQGRPGVPTGTLVFDVELVDFTAGPKPIAAPEDVAAAPKSAKKSKSGLAYKVLQPGSGTRRPGPNDTVEVHYTGWTTDGKMFDSSVMRGRTATFPLNGVIKGWSEALQLMLVGEKARFWIPADLAYGSKPQQPGAPAGTLVFDIELIAIR